MLAEFHINTPTCKFTNKLTTFSLFVEKKNYVSSIYIHTDVDNNSSYSNIY